MVEQRSPEWTALGKHAYREEPAEEIFFLRIRGDFAPEEAPLLGAAMRGFVRDGRDRLFILVDLSAMKDMPPEARKSIVESVASVPVAATAAFGASFAQRVIATLGDRASNLLRRAPRYPTRFFATEEQGRAWLGEQRLARART